MDERLAAMLGDGGYFVEAGAHDGFTQSNTYLLERRHGWRGLLVEPMPDQGRRTPTSSTSCAARWSSCSTRSRRLKSICCRSISRASSPRPCGAWAVAPLGGWSSRRTTPRRRPASTPPSNLDELHRRADVPPAGG
jgi:hypothetical protein